MDRIFCVCDNSGIKINLEVLSFITVDQYRPYSVRAVCVDSFGNVTTPSIEQIIVIKNKGE